MAAPQAKPGGTITDWYQVLKELMRSDRTGNSFGCTGNDSGADTVEGKAD